MRRVDRIRVTAEQPLEFVFPRPLVDEDVDQRPTTVRTRPGCFARGSEQSLQRIEAALGVGAFHERRVHIVAVDCGEYVPFGAPFDVDEVVEHLLEQHTVVGGALCVEVGLLADEPDRGITRRHGFVVLRAGAVLVGELFPVAEHDREVVELEFLRRRGEQFVRVGQPVLHTRVRDNGGDGVHLRDTDATFHARGCELREGLERPGEFRHAVRLRGRPVVRRSPPRRDPAVAIGQERSTRVDTHHEHRGGGLEPAALELQLVRADLDLRRRHHHQFLDGRDPQIVHGCTQPGGCDRVPRARPRPSTTDSARTPRCFSR